MSVTHYAFNKSVERNAVEVAERVAKQTFNSMYLVMSQGWNRAQLEAFVTQMETDNRSSELKVKIFRGERVNQKFGELDTGVLSNQVNEASSLKLGS